VKEFILCIRGRRVGCVLQWGTRGRTAMDAKQCDRMKDQYYSLASEGVPVRTLEAYFLIAHTFTPTNCIF
jgi:hypothetical protein